MSGGLGRPARRTLRTAALAVLWPVGIALIVGSGTGADGNTLQGDPLIPTLSPTANPGHIAIIQRETADVRVDVSEPGGSVTVAGFGVDLPESLADIAIDTGSCPAGAGSPSCQMWSITPGSRSIPGSYLISLTPQQPSGPVNLFDGRLDLEVVPKAPWLTQAAVQVDSSAAHAVDTSSHALFIDADGRLWGFGRSREGQVATSYLRTDVQARVIDSQPFQIPVPVRIGVPEYRWLQAIADGTRSFALRDNGILYRWGDHGALSGPEPVVAPPNIKAIVAFGRDARPAMLDRDGRLFRAEDGAELQIGTGPNSSEPLTGAVSLARLSDPIVSVLVPGPFAALADGRVAAFEVGSLPESRPVVAVITGYSGIESVAAGGTHLLGLRDDGAVMALGKNSAGQLGTGGTNDQVCSLARDGFCSAAQGSTACLDEVFRCTPVQVVGLGPAKAIAAKLDRSFALLEDGTVWTWGGGITTPVQVQNLQNIRTIGAGYAIGSECEAGGSLWGIDFPSSGPPTATRVFGVGELSACTGFAEIAAVVAADTVTMNLDVLPRSRSVGIDVFRSNYAGPVTLAVNGCPFDCVFSPNPVPADQTHSTLTLTLSDTAPPIPYELKIVTATGTGGVAPSSDTFVFRTVGGANVAPTAEFSFTPAEPRAAQAVSFDASASTDDDPLVSYEWDFTNDGTFDATGVAASRTYPEAGTYTTRLRVTDADGQTDEARRVINVQPASPTTVTLVVHVTGPGSVHITPGNIDCELECERTFDLVTPPTIVQLSPHPDSTATFNGWSGDCGEAQLANVTMSANRSCTALFSAAPPPPTGWSSLGAVTVLNIQGRPIAGFTSASLPPMVAYLESGGTISHVVVESYDLSTQGWGPVGPGAVNPDAVAPTNSFDFDAGGAGALVAWNEGNQIKLSQFTGNHWATLPQDLGIAGTNVGKDHVQVAARTIGGATEIFVAWREVTGGSRLAVARLDASLNIISRAYVSDIDTLADMQMVISPSGAATIACVTGDGVLPGPTLVLRETATGWEQLGGDATPGSDAAAMLVHGFGLTYEAGGAPIMIGNRGTSLFAHRFDGTSWLPLTGTDGTFTSLPAGQFVGGVSTLNDGTSVAFSRAEFVNSAYNFFFDVLTWNGSAWVALAPTLSLPSEAGQPSGGVFFSAGKFDTGPVYLVRSRDIGLSGGIEAHRYAP